MLNKGIRPELSQEGSLSKIEDIKNQVVEELKAQPTKDDRFRLLVQKGKSIGSLPDDQRDDKFLIKGCMSRAWLIPSFENGILNFKADSEATIVKGIISVLVEVYSGHSPEDILSVNPSFLKDAGIEEALSMNRRSGLANMTKQIMLYAATFKALSQT
jgi:cysteine desulfuration protein SufE